MVNYKRLSNDRHSRDKVSKWFLTGKASSVQTNKRRISYGEWPSCIKNAKSNAEYKPLYH